ncbi:MAG: peptidylprolyl isomerase [Dehalococcoidia bacterium]|nr:peptidylprolyl isomerase [Dehalococcoidia bacterium]
MDFKLLLISLALISSLVGSAFAETIKTQEFSQEEIDEMKHKAVLITMNDGTFMIELFPEDAPNTVKNFLTLVESGYYDGIVFHRIIPNFMIQAGDPTTKNPASDRSLWGNAGPGYTIQEEFNSIKHNSGIVSMARGNHPDSAGSQFFIVHKNSNHLDGKYTAFGRLVPGTYSDYTLDVIASLETDSRDAPLDVFTATIQKAKVLDPYIPSSSVGVSDLERIESFTKKFQTPAGEIDRYINDLHKVSFDLPYRWIAVEETGDYLNVRIEPGPLEHNVQLQIDESGFTPIIMVNSEERDLKTQGTEVNPEFFSIQGGDDPRILANYIYRNEEGRSTHIVVATQTVQTPTEPVEFKIIQLQFANSDMNYSVVYIHLEKWFRYEVNAFVNTVENFEIMIDGKMQPINFSPSPIFKQIIIDAKAAPEPEPEPPARVGGCLIATASYGSELAPQVQLLREIRDNTILQTQSGASFMTGFNQFYYSFSPMIADYERENPAFKEAVKLTLTPLLASLTLLQYVDIDSESEMLGYGIGVILLNIGMYFIAPAVLIMKIRSFYKLQ